VRFLGKEGGELRFAERKCSTRVTGTSKGNVQAESTCGGGTLKQRVCGEMKRGLWRGRVGEIAGKDPEPRMKSRAACKNCRVGKRGLKKSRKGTWEGLGGS